MSQKNAQRGFGAKFEPFWFFGFILTKNSFESVQVVVPISPIVKQGSDR
jgi:hypothetical protein